MKKGDYNWKDVWIMLSILKIKNSKELKHLTASSLSRQIGLSVHDSCFNSIIKILKEKNIIKIKSVIAGANLLEIDFNKLRDYITKQEIVKTIYYDLLVNQWKIKDVLVFD